MGHATVGFRIRKLNGILRSKKGQGMKHARLDLESQAYVTGSLRWAVVGLELCREHSS